MMLFRKHYDDIAEIIHNNINRTKTEQGSVKNVIDADDFIEKLSEYFKIEFENFDMDKFIRTCYTGK